MGLSCQLAYMGLTKTPTDCLIYSLDLNLTRLAFIILTKGKNLFKKSVLTHSKGKGKD